MYDYHNSDLRAGRLTKGQDHCDSAGKVYDLADLAGSDLIVDPELGVVLTTTHERRLIYAVSGDRRMARAVLDAFENANVPASDAVLDFLRMQAGR